MKIRDFVYGKQKYKYFLIRNDRKTLGLTVRPNLSIIVKAPTKATVNQIDEFLKKKWLWLDKQLVYFQKFQKKYFEKEYVSGEAFLYLGRQYTLKVRQYKNKEEVELSKGILLIKTIKRPSNGFHNKKLIENWYQQRIDQLFFQRYQKVLKKFDYDFIPKLEVRKMSKRWGSFLSKKKIYLNPELIKASTDCIDYVITHELCHMVYKNHSQDFYKLLKSKLPEWEKTKEKLELRLS